MNKAEPDYKRIYSDMINTKYPDKKESCKVLLEKPKLSVLDVIQINKKIFGVMDKETEVFNQKHRSYDKTTILEILNYQKSKKLSNIELADHFKLSRNTVAKWKKRYE